PTRPARSPSGSRAARRAARSSTATHLRAHRRIARNRTLHRNRQAADRPRRRPAGFLIAPPAGRAGDRLKRDGEPERLGERLQRREELRVWVAGQRLAWRIERGRLDTVEWCDL